jgi:hypothetical protein
MKLKTIDELNEGLPMLKVGTAPTNVEVVSEPFIRLTFRGYVPCLKVKVVKSGLDYALAINAKSLTEALDKIRKQNEGFFVGLKFQLCKKDESQMAPYILR